jgi:hypothetical protein
VKLSSGPTRTTPSGLELTDRLETSREFEVCTTLGITIRAGGLVLAIRYLQARASDGLSDDGEPDETGSRVPLKELSTVSMDLAHHHM